MRIGDQTVDRVRALIDVVALVGELVALRRTGRNHVGLCPFHQEKTPSFSVNPEKGVFHCFGCGKGGDVFTFVMETQGVGFLDAVRILAERAGVEIEQSAGHSRAEALYQLNAFAARFFQEVLLRRPEGAPARRYAQSRGIDQELAKKLGLGAAPDSWSALHERALAEGFDPELLKTGGLSVDRRDGKGHYDRFRNRLIFPIRAVTGRVVAFGGRCLSDDQRPKYINSPETPAYRKGEHLYGLAEARDAIRSARTALVVEGYTDCIAMHRAGIVHAVAALGTAFTPRQGELLRRYADDVILVFDADAAGQAAALRGMGVLLSKGLRVQTAILPPGSDPDSLLAQGGAEALREVISRPSDAVRHHLEEFISDLRDAGPAQRVRGVAPLVDALQSIDDSALRDAYLAEVAGRIRVDPRALRRGQPARQISKEVEAPAEAPLELNSSSTELLRLALSDAAGRTFARIEAERVDDSRVRGIYTMLAKTYQESGAVELGRVLAAIDDPAIRSALTAIAASPETESIDLDRLLDDVAADLQRRADARTRWELNRRLDREQDPARRREILLELTKLLQKKQRRI